MQFKDFYDVVKIENFQFFIFFLFCAKHKLWYTLGGSNEYPHSESEKFTGDTPNDIISPGGLDGGEISPLNARVKRTWTHNHLTFQQ